ncbi:MAG: endo-1,4-beta-xylanase [Cyanobacteria bacterium P01_G01_bin.49]
MTRRKAIYLGGATLATTTLMGSLPKPNTLKSYAAAKGLLYGAAGAYAHLSDNREFAQRFIEECAVLTPENDLKWQTIHPKPNDYDFGKGDWMAKFARTHKLQLRGHNLVWHDAIPDWVKETVNPENAASVLKDHIATVAGHYQGSMHSWDVVNEAINIGDGHPLGLRKSHWFNWLGEDYIDIAFQAAAEADPQALLVYNDYDLDYDTPAQNARREAVFKLLERLKARGTPIHALGLQAHLVGRETRFNPDKMRQFLADVASLGLKIMVTEMDVSDQGLPADYGERDRRIADVYEMYLSTVLDEPNVMAVLTWGLSDRYTWLSGYRPRKDNIPVRPLPLDRTFQPKLAWESITKTFANL